MNTNRNAINPECAQVEALLAEYVENTLSARQAWDVEKHLAACANCARSSREMQATVALLRSVERRDTSDDFMARLHSRIDALEPETVRARTWGSVWRDGWAALGAAWRSYRVPALSMGVAASAVAAFMLSPRTVPTPIAESTQMPSSVTQIAAEPLRRNAALAAGNPFDDPVAAALEEHSETNDER
jgi:anti-sigma-K factor RskA